MIFSQIQDLQASKGRQIKVEFEGFAPEFKMSQDQQIEDLHAQLISIGHIVIADVLYSAADITAKRSQFNGLVKAYAAANPGKGAPVASIKEWSGRVGMSMMVLKSAVVELGL